MAEYAPAVAHLLTLGPTDPFLEWPDYRTMGLGPEHVPELIGLATDPALHAADSRTDASWAPVHACRALGQLRAKAAIGPLLELLQAEEGQTEDDWAAEDLPEAFALIGPPAIPELEAFLADHSRGLYARAAVADALSRIPEKHPRARVRCEAVLTSHLERAADNGPELNGFLVDALLNLNAVDAAPTIERAFDADLVDESIAGDWKEVQWELGLSDQPPAPHDYRGAALHPQADEGEPGPGEAEPPLPRRSAKAKRKAGRKGRKRRRRER